MDVDQVTKIKDRILQYMPVEMVAGLHHVVLLKGFGRCTRAQRAPVTENRIKFNFYLSVLLMLLTLFQINFNFLKIITQRQRKMEYIITD